MGLDIEALIFILMIWWLFGVASGMIMGGGIHVLLVVIFILIVLRVLRDR